MECRHESGSTSMVDRCESMSMPITSMIPILNRILNHPTLYLPKEKEVELVEECYANGYLHYVDNEVESGFHITRKGIRVLNESMECLQGND